MNDEDADILMIRLRQGFIALLDGEGGAKEEELIRLVDVHLIESRGAAGLIWAFYNAAPRDERIAWTNSALVALRMFAEHLCSQIAGNEVERNAIEYDGDC